MNTEKSFLNIDYTSFNSNNFTLTNKDKGVVINLDHDSFEEDYECLDLDPLEIVTLESAKESPQIDETSKEQKGSEWTSKTCQPVHLIRIEYENDDEVEDRQTANLGGCNKGLMIDDRTSDLNTETIIPSQNNAIIHYNPSSQRYQIIEPDGVLTASNRNPILSWKDERPRICQEKRSILNGVVLHNNRQNIGTETTFNKNSNSVALETSGSSIQNAAISQTCQTIETSNQVGISDEDIEYLTIERLNKALESLGKLKVQDALPVNPGTREIPVEHAEVKKPTVNFEGGTLATKKNKFSAVDSTDERFFTFGIRRDNMGPVDNVTGASPVQRDNNFTGINGSVKKTKLERPVPKVGKRIRNERRKTVDYSKDLPKYCHNHEIVTERRKSSSDNCEKVADKASKQKEPSGIIDINDMASDSESSRLNCTELGTMISASSMDQSDKISSLECASHTQFHNVGEAKKIMKPGSRIDYDIRTQHKFNDFLSGMEIVVGRINTIHNLFRREKTTVPNRKSDTISKKPDGVTSEATERLESEHVDVNGLSVISSQRKNTLGRKRPSTDTTISDFALEGNKLLKNCGKYVIASQKTSSHYETDAKLEESCQIVVEDAEVNNETVTYVQTSNEYNKKVVQNNKQKIDNLDLLENSKLIVVDHAVLPVETIEISVNNDINETDTFLQTPNTNIREQMRNKRPYIDRLDPLENGKPKESRRIVENPAILPLETINLSVHNEINETVDSVHTAKANIRRGVQSNGLDTDHLDPLENGKPEGISRIVDHSAIFPLEFIDLSVNNKINGTVTSVQTENVNLRIEVQKNRPHTDHLDSLENVTPKGSRRIVDNPTILPLKFIDISDDNEINETVTPVQTSNANIRGAVQSNRLKTDHLNPLENGKAEGSSPIVDNPAILPLEFIDISVNETVTSLNTPYDNIRGEVQNNRRTSDHKDPLENGKSEESRRIVDNPATLRSEFVDMSVNNEIDKTITSVQIPNANIRRVVQNNGLKTDYMNPLENGRPNGSGQIVENPAILPLITFDISADNEIEKTVTPFHTPNANIREAVQNRLKTDYLDSLENGKPLEFIDISVINEIIGTGTSVQTPNVNIRRAVQNNRPKTDHLDSLENGIPKGSSRIVDNAAILPLEFIDLSVNNKINGTVTSVQTENVNLRREVQKNRPHTDHLDSLETVTPKGSRRIVDNPTILPLKFIDISDDNEINETVTPVQTSNANIRGAVQSNRLKTDHLNPLENGKAEGSSPIVDNPAILPLEFIDISVNETVTSLNTPYDNIRGEVQNNRRTSDHKDPLENGKSEESRRIVDNPATLPLEFVDMSVNNEIDKSITSVQTPNVNIRRAVQNNRSKIDHLDPLENGKPKGSRRISENPAILPLETIDISDNDKINETVTSVHTPNANITRPVQNSKLKTGHLEELQDGILKESRRINENRTILPLETIEISVNNQINETVTYLQTPNVNIRGSVQNNKLKTDHLNQLENGKAEGSSRIVDNPAILPLEFIDISVNETVTSLNTPYDNIRGEIQNNRRTSDHKDPLENGKSEESRRIVDNPATLQLEFVDMSVNNEIDKTITSVQTPNANIRRVVQNNGLKTDYMNPLENGRPNGSGQIVENPAILPLITIDISADNEIEKIVTPFHTPNANIREAVQNRLKTDYLDSLENGKPLEFIDISVINEIIGTGTSVQTPNVDIRRAVQNNRSKTDHLDSLENGTPKGSSRIVDNPAILPLKFIDISDDDEINETVTSVQTSTANIRGAVQSNRLKRDHLDQLENGKAEGSSPIVDNPAILPLEFIDISVNETVTSLNTPYDNISGEVQNNRRTSDHKDPLENGKSEESRRIVDNPATLQLEFVDMSVNNEIEKTVTPFHTPNANIREAVQNRLKTDYLDSLENGKPLEFIDISVINEIIGTGTSVQTPNVNIRRAVQNNRPKTDHLDSLENGTPKGSSRIVDNPAILPLEFIDLSVNNKINGTVTSVQTENVNLRREVQKNRPHTDHLDSLETVTPKGSRRIVDNPTILPLKFIDISDDNEINETVTPVQTSNANIRGAVQSNRLKTDHLNPLENGKAEGSSPIVDNPAILPLEFIDISVNETVTSLNTPYDNIRGEVQNNRRTSDHKDPLENGKSEESRRIVDNPATLRSEFVDMSVNNEIDKTITSVQTPNVNVRGVVQNNGLKTNYLNPLENGRPKGSRQIVENSTILPLITIDISADNETEKTVTPFHTPNANIREAVQNNRLKTDHLDPLENGKLEGSSRVVDHSAILPLEFIDLSVNKEINETVTSVHAPNANIRTVQNNMLKTDHLDPLEIVKPLPLEFINVSCNSEIFETVTSAQTPNVNIKRVVQKNRPKTDYLNPLEIGKPEGSSGTVENLTILLLGSIEKPVHNETVSSVQTSNAKIGIAVQHKRLKTDHLDPLEIVKPKESPRIVENPSILPLQLFDVSVNNEIIETVSSVQTPNVNIGRVVQNIRPKTDYLNPLEKGKPEGSSQTVENPAIKEAVQLDRLKKHHLNPLESGTPKGSRRTIENPSILPLEFIDISVNNIRRAVQNNMPKTDHLDPLEDGKPKGSSRTVGNCAILPLESIEKPVSIETVTSGHTPNANSIRGLQNNMPKTDHLNPLDNGKPKGIRLIVQNPTTLPSEIIEVSVNNEIEETVNSLQTPTVDIRGAVLNNRLQTDHLNPLEKGAPKANRRIADHHAILPSETIDVSVSNEINETVTSLQTPNVKHLDPLENGKPKGSRRIVENPAIIPLETIDISDDNKIKETVTSVQTPKANITKTVQNNRLKVDHLDTLQNDKPEGSRRIVENPAILPLETIDLTLNNETVTSVRTTNVNIRRAVNNRPKTDHMDPLENGNCPIVQNTAILPSKTIEVSVNNEFEETVTSLQTPKVNITGGVQNNRLKTDHLNALEKGTPKANRRIADQHAILQSETIDVSVINETLQTPNANIRGTVQTNRLNIDHLDPLDNGKPKGSGPIFENPAILPLETIDISDNNKINETVTSVQTPKAKIRRAVQNNRLQVGQQDPLSNGKPKGSRRIVESSAILPLETIDLTENNETVTSDRTTNANSKRAVQNNRLTTDNLGLLKNGKPEGSRRIVENPTGSPLETIVISVNNETNETIISGQTPNGNFKRSVQNNILKINNSGILENANPKANVRIVENLAILPLETIDLCGNNEISETVTSIQTPNANISRAAQNNGLKNDHLDLLENGIPKGFRRIVENLPVLPRKSIKLLVLNEINDTVTSVQIPNVKTRLSMLKTGNRGLLENDDINNTVTRCQKPSLGTRREKTFNHRATKSNELSAINDNDRAVIEKRNSCDKSLEKNEIVRKDKHSDFCWSKESERKIETKLGMRPAYVLISKEEISLANKAILKKCKNDFKIVTEQNLDSKYCSISSNNQISNSKISGMNKNIGEINETVDKTQNYESFVNMPRNNGNVIPIRRRASLNFENDSLDKNIILTKNINCSKNIPFVLIENELSNRKRPISEEKIVTTKKEVLATSKNRTMQAQRISKEINETESEKMEANVVEGVASQEKTEAANVNERKNGQNYNDNQDILNDSDNSIFDKSMEEPQQMKKTSLIEGSASTSRTIVNCNYEMKRSNGTVKTGAKSKTNVSKNTQIVKVVEASQNIRVTSSSTLDLPENCQIKETVTKLPEENVVAKKRKAPEYNREEINESNLENYKINVNGTKRTLCSSKRTETSPKRKKIIVKNPLSVDSNDEFQKSNETVNSGEISKTKCSRNDQLAKVVESMPNLRKTHIATSNPPVNYQINGTVTILPKQTSDNRKRPISEEKNVTTKKEVLATSKNRTMQAQRISKEINETESEKMEASVVEGVASQEKTEAANVNERKNGQNYNDNQDILKDSDNSIFDKSMEEPQQMKKTSLIEGSASTSRTTYPKKPIVFIRNELLSKGNNQKNDEINGGDTNRILTSKNVPPPERTEEKYPVKNLSSVNCNYEMKRSNGTVKTGAKSKTNVSKNTQIVKVVEASQNIRVTSSSTLALPENCQIKETVTKLPEENVVAKKMKAPEYNREEINETNNQKTEANILEGVASQEKTGAANINERKNNIVDRLLAKFQQMKNTSLIEGSPSISGTTYSKKPIVHIENDLLSKGHNRKNYEINGSDTNRILPSKNVPPERAQKNSADENLPVKHKSSVNFNYEMERFNGTVKTGQISKSKKQTSNNLGSSFPENNVLAEKINGPEAGENTGMKSLDPTETQHILEKINETRSQKIEVNILEDVASEETTGPANVNKRKSNIVDKLLEKLQQMKNTSLIEESSSTYSKIPIIIKENYLLSKGNNEKNYPEQIDETKNQKIEANVVGSVASQEETEPTNIKQRIWNKRKYTKNLQINEAVEGNSSAENDSRDKRIRKVEISTDAATRNNGTVASDINLGKQYAIGLIKTVRRLSEAKSSSETDLHRSNDVSICFGDDEETDNTQGLSSPFEEYDIDIDNSCQDEDTLAATSSKVTPTKDGLNCSSRMELNMNMLDNSLNKFRRKNNIRNEHDDADPLVSTKYLYNSKKMINTNILFNGQPVQNPPIKNPIGHRKLSSYDQLTALIILNKKRKQCNNASIETVPEDYFTAANKENHEITNRIHPSVTVSPSRQIQSLNVQNRRSNFFLNHILNRHHQENMSETQCCLDKTRIARYFTEEQPIKWKRHQPKLEHRCDLCDFRHVSLKFVNYHIRKKHATKKQRKCGACSYTTYRQYMLDEHESNEHNDALGKGKQQERYRKRRGAIDNVATFECAYCGYDTRSRRLFDLHRRSSHPETPAARGNEDPSGESSVVDCDDEKTVYESRETNRGWRGENVKQSLVQSSCGIIVVHQYRHFVLCKIVYKCADCDFQRNRLHFVETHRSKWHPKRVNTTDIIEVDDIESATNVNPTRQRKMITKHVCKYCMFISDSAICLKEHTLNKHTLKVYSCVLCGFETGLETSLRQHLLVHEASVNDRKVKRVKSVHGASVNNRKVKRVNSVHRVLLKNDRKVKRVKRRPRTIYCLLCNFSCKHWKTLQHHVNNKHNCDRKQAQAVKTTCDLCGYKANELKTLLEHINDVHFF